MKREDGAPRRVIEVDTPFIKLDAFLKFCGEASTGGHAKVLVLEKQVLVDGEICTQRGKKLYPGAVVTVRQETPPDGEYEVAARAH